MTRPLLNRRLDGLGNSDLRRDVRPRRRHRLGQPRPGVPRRRRPAGRRRGRRRRRSWRARQPVPARPPASPSCGAAVARHQRRFYGLGYDPDTEVLITAGATEAIAAALLALLEPGDEVIAFEPYYDSYVANIAMAGAIRVPLTLRPPDFRPDLAELESADHRARPGCCCSTARTTRRAWSSPAPRPRRSRDRHRPRPAGHHRRGLRAPHVRPRAHPVRDRRRDARSGPSRSARAGKTFSFTGWKVGWATGTPELVNAVRTTKQFLTFVASGPFQYAVAEALDLPDELLHRPGRDLKAKRDLMAQGLQRDRLRGLPARRHVLHHHRHRAASARRTRWSSASACRTGRAWWRSRARSSTTTPEAGRTQVRFAFCKRQEILKEALSRLEVLAY